MFLSETNGVVSKVCIAIESDIVYRHEKDGK